MTFDFDGKKLEIKRNKRKGRIKVKFQEFYGIWSILEALPAVVNVVSGNLIVKEWDIIIFAGN